MSHIFSIPIRKECPPGACVCDRDQLLADPDGDTRILKLTMGEEKKLITHIENISNYADLKRIQDRLRQQLGIEIQVRPGGREVRTVRGIVIRLVELPGLCRKTRQSIPAAFRRCLEKNPDIAYAVLDSHDLLGAGKDLEIITEKII